MSLRFLDSYDHYTNLGQKYTATKGATINAGSARTGIQGLQLSGVASPNATLTLTPQQTWILGFGFRVHGISGSYQTICGVLDAGTEQVSLRVLSDYTLQLSRAGVALATSLYSIMVGLYYFIEFKVRIADVGGIAEVRVNESTWATFNGDTQNTANPTANQIQLGGSGGLAAPDLRYDDLYVLDGVGGPPNNDYWGQTQIECLKPNGNGFYTQWATLVGAATHWQAVSEVPPDEDTSYVADSTVGNRDTYTLQDLSLVSAQINGIQVLIRAREDTAAGTAIRRVYRNAGVDNVGPDVILDTGYAYYIREILETDPVAAGPWTVPNINSAEIGCEVR
jgi:hypothetical protein